MTATEYVTDWRSLGACVSADPDLFFPISSTGPAISQIEQAKAICADCQVKQQCLDFALSTHQVDGVWGGTNAEERQLLRRRQVAQAARVKGGSRGTRGRPVAARRSRPPRR